MSRYGQGGFTPRFTVTRTDGQPCRPDARYMVLDGSGADPAAVVVLKVYAALVDFPSDPNGRQAAAAYAAELVGKAGPEVAKNADLAADLRAMLRGEWPASLAQHEDAV